MLAPFSLAATLVAATSGTPCSGAAPGIVTAGIASAATNGDTRHYTVAITVTNQGRARQPGNLLQSVDVYQNGDRVGKIGLQPLRAHQSQTVTYGFDRAADAGDGTTHLRLQLDYNGRTGNTIDCGTGPEVYRLNV